MLPPCRSCSLACVLASGLAPVFALGLALGLALGAGACATAGSDRSASPDPAQGRAQGSPDPSSTPSTSASAAQGYTATQYPIVLAHGLGGSRQLVGVVDYWYGITGDLESTGARVFVTQVSAVNTSVVRGEQLLAQIEQILAMTGASKVNLIAHSQGGLDARYVMGVRPDLIASLTAVATPNLGGAISDILLDYASQSGSNLVLVQTLGDALGTFLDLVAGSPDAPQDVINFARATSTAGAMEFNRQFPAGMPATRCGATATSNGAIPLFSWVGSSVRTNPLDAFDLVFERSAQLETDVNDGLVGRCSARFGKVLRDDYRMNHLDVINQFFGLTSIFETSPVAVFRAHANRLKIAGL